MNYHIIGDHPITGPGLIATNLDEFTAHRIMRDLYRQHPSIQLFMFTGSEVERDARLTNYMASRGVASIHHPVGYQYPDSFHFHVFVRPELLPLPGSDSYNNYLKTIDNIIRDDWSLVEELDTGLMEMGKPFIVSGYGNILSDIYDRRAYLESINFNFNL